MRKFVAPFTLLFSSLSLVASAPKIQPLSTLMFDGQIKTISTELRRQWDFLCEGNEKTITSKPWDTLQALSLLYRDSRANSRDFFVQADGLVRRGRGATPCRGTPQAVPCAIPSAIPVRYQCDTQCGTQCETLFSKLFPWGRVFISEI